MPSRLAAIAAIAALAAPFAAHAQPIPVTGEVIGMDGRPLAGAEARLFPQLSAYEEARLRLSGKAAEPAATATTGADGRFRLTAPRPGMWRVVVQWTTMAAHFELTPLTAPSLLPRVPLGKDFHLALWFGPSSRRTASANWEVGAEPRPAPTEVPSGCKRTLKILSGNRPVAGAVVLAGTVPQELSSSLGLLTVIAACSSPREIEIGAADGKRATVQLPDGERQEPLSVSLRPRPLAHGQVLDAQSGLPVAGAMVWPEGEPPAFVVTDARGGYQAPLPPADAPRLHAAAAGYFIGKETTATSGPQPVAGPTLRLAPAATVAGTVVDEKGQPVAGARLAALPLDLAAAEPLLTLQISVLPHGTALSDAGGEFSLRIAAGLVHALEALHPAYAPEVVQIAAPAAGEVVALRLVLKRGITAFGRVVTLDGEPVPGARVALVRAAEAEADEEWKDLVPLRERSVTTGGEGRFSMARLAADRYHLGAIAPGYAPTVVRGVQIPEGGERYDLGTLALERAVTLSGRVVERDGTPIAGAWVEATRESGATWTRWQLGERKQETESDADGRFTFTDLSPGEVRLWARKDDRSTDLSVELPAEQPVEVMFKLHVVCRVVDEAGKPVSSFHLDFAPLGVDEQPVRRFGFGPGVAGSSSGELSLELPGPGRYRITANAYGFLPGSRIVEVGPEGLAHPVTMVLSAGGAVAGRVTDADGAPVAGAEVALPEEYSTTETDGDGSFRFTGVIPGRRTFTASRKGFQTQLLNLEVQPGDNRLDFQLAPGVPVSGRVITAGGSPVAGAAVYLHADPLANEAPEQTASAADGSFAFAGVAPGTYEITATKPGLADGPGETVTVGSAPVLGVDVRLPAGGVVVGWVKGLDFSALAQVEIVAYSPSVREERAGTRPDYEGKFRLEQVAPGSWTIFATAGAREIKRHVEVSAGGEAHVELEFRSGFRLSGRVTAGGAAAELAHLVLSGLDNDSFGQMSVEADGTFAFSDLAAGRYLLEIHDYFRRRPREQILEITADRELLIELPQERRVSGRVVDTAGEPVADVRVVVEPEDASVSSITRKTDADGRFVVPDLVPGPHRLIAAREGFAAAEARFTIPENGDLEDLVLTLSPAALLTLDVAGPTGVTPPWIETALLFPDGRTVTVETCSPGPGGRFELRGAAPGTYRLLVAAPGSSTAATEVTIPGRHQVSLTQPAIVAIRVPALARTQFGARLAVLGDDGRPFRRIDDGEVTADWHLSFGAAELTVLPAGTWRLVATSPDGRRWEKQVAVTAGEHTEVVIE